MSSNDVVKPKHRGALKAAILLGLAVMAGVLAGVVGDRIVLLRQRRLLPRQGLEMVSARIVRVMDRELDLSDAQEKEVRRIVEHHRRAIDALWSDLRPRVREEIHKGEVEIRAILDDRQAKDYDALLRKWRHRAKVLTGPHGPP